MAYITKKQYDQLVSILAQLNLTLTELRDALRGVDARTHTDLYNQLSSLVTNLGTQSYDAGGWLLTRQKHALTFRKATYSGTVGAGARVYYIDISGHGVVLNPFRHYSSGIGVGNAIHKVEYDTYDLDYEWYNISKAGVWGHNAGVGDYLLTETRVKTWDTVNNIYDIYSLKRIVFPFNSSLDAYLMNTNGVDSTQVGTTFYALSSSTTLLEFIRNTAIDYRAVDVRQQLIDMNYESSVCVDYCYDEALAITKPLLAIYTEKTLAPQQVDEIVKFVYDNEYAVEIVRVENVLASPRKLLYKVTPIETIQSAIAKVCRVGIEIPVLPRLRGGRIEETVTLIPDWLSRLRPDLVGRVHSTNEINEILTTKPFEILP